VVFKRASVKRSSEPEMDAEMVAPELGGAAERIRCVDGPHGRAIVDAHARGRDHLHGGHATVALDPEGDDRGRPSATSGFSQFAPMSWSIWST